MTRLAEAREENEVLTGLFYLNPGQPSFTDMLNLVDQPIGTLPPEIVRPSKSVFEGIMKDFQ